MFYNRKKRLANELSKMFQDVSITDKKGNVFYCNGKKIVCRKIDNSKELEKVRNKINAGKNKVRFFCNEDKLNQKVSKVVNVGRELVLVRFNYSPKESVCDFNEKTNSTLKFVMDHDTRLYTDILTGTYNRLYLSDVLSRKNIGAVAMIDVDDFKKINDNFGHVVGDRVLQDIAKTIMLCVANYGKVVRFGGDEFVVVFDSIEKDLLRSILREISKRVAALSIENLFGQTSVSVGAIVGSGNVVDMIDRADKVMYDIKKGKK